MLVPERSADILHTPPLEERIDEAWPLLAQELAAAHAPVTGRRVACILETQDALYAGHNYEYDPGHFEHAEEAALSRMGKDAPIERVYIAGEGQRKLKHVSPCSECYDLLSPRLAAHAELVLFEPDTSEKNYAVLSPQQHREAYVPKPYLNLSGSTVKEAADELLHVTPLTARDAKFIANLRFLGLKNDILFYLTGSASGRGGVSNVINPGCYGDLDIIAVTEGDRRDAEDTFEAAANEFYGALGRVSTSVNIWFIGEKRYGNRFSNDEISMDFRAAPTLKDGMTRMDYLRKNFFIQIS
jgi:cytidine deaminase